MACFFFWGGNIIELVIFSWRVLCLQFLKKNYLSLSSSKKWLHCQKKNYNYCIIKSILCNSWGCKNKGKDWKNISSEFRGFNPSLCHETIYRLVVFMRKVNLSFCKIHVLLESKWWYYNVTMVFVADYLGS